MIKLIFFTFISILSFSNAANAAAPFDSISIQGFLKTASGVPVSSTVNGKVTLLQNSAPCWNSGAALIPITISDGAFSKTLSGGISTGACSGSLGSAHFMVTAPFTWTLELDIDNNGSPETTFSNIPITAVPIAMIAESIAGTLPANKISSGTFGSIDAGALINLNAANISSGQIPLSRLGSGTPTATNYLRGDGSWQSLPTLGESNTASNLGSGSFLFKQRIGVDLQFRSLVAGSSKLALATNTSDVSLDLNEANIDLANIGGTLSGSQISGGTFGAVDGSAITSLNANNLTTGTVSSTLLPAAGASASGIVTTAAQTLAGAKTFSGPVTLASTLTNSGAFAWSKTDVATATTITCLASTTPVVRLTGIAVTSVQGISPGVDGQVLLVYTDGNIGTGLTIAHNNAGGCANGRIFTNSNANVVSTVATSTAAFMFMYNGGSLRWHLITALQ